MKLKNHIILFSLIAWAGVLPLQAQEPSASSSQPAASETLTRLRQIKEENPEEFERLIQERKSQIKSKAQELRENSPEKFEGFRKQVSEKRMDRLKRMKQENPQEFQRDMTGRAERFKRMKQEKPQEFQKFIEKHPQLNERISKNSFRQENSVAKSAQNDSQFVSRSDFRGNSRGRLVEGQPSQGQRGSEIGKSNQFSRKDSHIQEQMSQNSARNDRVSGSEPRQFQGSGNSSGEGRNFRPFQQSHERNQSGTNKGGSKPSDGAKPIRGGSGDGARRHNR